MKQGKKKIYTLLHKQFKKGKNVRETIENVNEAEGPGVVSTSTAYRWFKQ